jgi:hypothetical protein
MGLVGMCVLVSANAWAQPREQGELAVSAERLMGFSRSSETSEGDYGKSTSTSTNISLLSAPLSGFFSAYSVPRIGFDYFVAEGVSIGGSFSYAHVGFTSEDEPTDGPSSESDSSFDMVMLVPRVGYAYMFSDHVGIWPRAGVTYMRAWTEFNDDDSSTGSTLALSVEAPFLFAPTDNIAITFGPTLDYGLTDSSESTVDGLTTEDDDDEPPTEFGVQAGLTVFF